MMAKSYENLFEKGIALQEEGKYEQSLACFQQTIGIEPKFIPAWIYQGISLEKLQRYQEAISCYEQAINIHPDVAELWYNKGTAYCKIKRYNDALTCFEKVLKLEPDNPFARTAQSLVIAIPPVFNPMPKQTESERNKAGSRTQQAKLRVARQVKNSAHSEGYGTETERS